MDKLLLTRKEAACVLNISVNTLDELKRSKKLTVFTSAPEFISPQMNFDLSYQEKVW